MSDEVDWVLEQFGSVVGSITAPLKRVDRDESEILEDSIRSRTGELQDASFVGATLADVANTPIGTEYDYAREAVVGVRVEGLHHSEWGHIDPDGVEGIAFDELVRRLRDAVHTERTYPDAGGTDVAYTHLTIQNETYSSSDYSDFFRADFDVVFDGFEGLP